MADQPRGDELGDRADGVGERDLRVGEVRVVQVDGVDAEVAQALLGVAAHERRVGVDAQLTEREVDREAVHRGAVGDPEPELGGDHDAVAPRSRSARPTSRSLWPSGP